MLAHPGTFRGPPCYLRAVQLRPSVSDVPFDRARFADLREQYRAGTLSPAATRLSTPPEPLRDGEVIGLATDLEPSRAAQLRELGEHALKAGKIGVLILNGGMAMRFGGVAKGTVPILDGSTETFLSVKLRGVARMAQKVRARIPAAVMHSFATREASAAHLEAIDWAEVRLDDRETFVQSIMPRVTRDGVPLQEHPLGEQLPDTALYAAPGHGDTLARVRESGTVARLRRRGVEHVLLSNVDNLGASLDPLVVGAHVEGVAEGRRLSVEVVRRDEGDRGGCVARLSEGPARGRAAIVEGFRLPDGTDVADYPHFNTNTLWFALDALEGGFPLTWFPVEREVVGPDGNPIPIAQFEQLVGQATEFLPTRYLEVDRAKRFIPIKTRDDLARAAPQLSAVVAGLAR